MGCPNHIETYKTYIFNSNLHHGHICIFVYTNDMFTRKWLLGMHIEYSTALHTYTHLFTCIIASTTSYASFWWLIPKAPCDFLLMKLVAGIAHRIHDVDYRFLLPCRGWATRRKRMQNERKWMQHERIWMEIERKWMDNERKHMQNERTWMQNARKWMEKNKHIMFAMVLIHLYHMICLQEIGCRECT